MNLRINTGFSRIARHLILTVAFCFSVVSWAQIKHIGLPDIRNYRKNEYKAGTQNWAVDQDARGMVYFANNNGMLQFDGSSWTNYPLPVSPSVRSLRIGLQGQVYVGGYNEFGYFLPGEQGRLEYHSISVRINPDARKLIDFIWKIHVLGDEVIFQSFAKLYVYKDGKLRILDAPDRFQFSFAVEGKCYIQDVSKGLLRYEEGKLIPLKGTSSLNETEVWGMFSLGEAMLVATIDKGLFRYQSGKLLPWATEANTFMLRNSCLGGAAIGSGFIALNSVLDGVIICDLQGNIVQHIDQRKGLQNNTVLSSFVDNNQNLWLGLDNGIAFVNENSPFTFFGSSYELSAVYATVIYDGKLYVATNRGVYYHDWSTPFREDTFQLVKGTTGQAWNLQIIDGALVCGHNRGAMLLKGDHVERILDTKGYWCFRKVPGRPDLILAANYSGFSVFEIRDGVMTFRNQVDGYDKSVGIFEMDDRYIWFRKDDQIMQLMLSGDMKGFRSVKVYGRLSDQDKGIGSVQKIRGKLYFQLQNHFYSYYREEDRFRPEPYYTKLFAGVPVARSIFEDREGNLWYIHGESIAAFMKSGTGYVNVSAPFSNLSGELVANYENVYTSGSGNIFIGLANGLVHYDAGLQRNFSAKPLAFIRTFAYGERAVVLGNGPMKKQQFDVPYRGNNVRFTFSSPTYENPENIEYSYKLEGFDAEWSPWSSVSAKEYTNLHEGDYQMLVRVRNSFGITSEQAQLPFSVSPPWYRHFLAYFAYVLLAVVSVYYLRRRTSAKIRKNKYYETLEQRRLYLERESRIRQEQYELEKEIEKLKNEKLKISLLSKDKELVNNSLQVVKKNKILNGIIQKMKDIDVDTMDEETRFQLTKINKSIAKEMSADKSWKDLEKHIKNVHFDFLKRLKEKSPTISPRELDLATYLLMNMSTKEIAEIMNISKGGVELARYRLRKKLGLTKKENLVGYLMSI